MFRASRVLARSYSSTAVRRGAAAGGDHSGPKHIHKHPMFEGDFKKSTVAKLVWGSLFGGTGLISFAVGYQQWKAGLLFKRSD